MVNIQILLFGIVHVIARSLMPHQDYGSHAISERRRAPNTEKSKKPQAWKMQREKCSRIIMAQSESSGSKNIFLGQCFFICVVGSYVYVSLW